MLPIGSPLKPSQIDLLMLHGRLQLNDYRWICCENDEVFIKEEKNSVGSSLWLGSDHNPPLFYSLLPYQVRNKYFAEY